MAKSKNSNQWDAMVAKFEPVRAGESAMTASDAARELGVSEAAVRKAMQSGRIAPADLRYRERANGKRVPLLTASAIEKYKASRSPEAPVARKVPADVVQESGAETVAPFHLEYAPADNLQDAKLKEQNLKNERLVAENMLARNQSMLIQDVIDINREVDLELVAALRSYVFRVAPMVAGETDILRCRTILETEMKEAMAVLEKESAERWHDRSVNSQR